MPQTLSILPSIILSLTAILTNAAPTNTTGSTSTITATSILRIDPSTSSCAHAPIADECRTATQAAPYVAISFTNYGIRDFATQAALVALMLYETGGFAYSVNRYPGIPGQGTRNMQSPAYNMQYAEYLATECENCGISREEVAEAKAAGPRAVLRLVNTDEWGFGSAAWFLTTQCSDAVKEGLATGSAEGWENWLQECVGTSVNEQRRTLWQKALALKKW